MAQRPVVRVRPDGVRRRADGARLRVETSVLRDDSAHRVFAEAGATGFSIVKRRTCVDAHVSDYSASHSCCSSCSTPLPGAQAQRAHQSKRRSTLNVSATLRQFIDALE